jgi:hypothetical protein
MSEKEDYRKNFQNIGNIGRLRGLMKGYPFKKILLALSTTEFALPEYKTWIKHWSHAGYVRHECQREIH